MLELKPTFGFEFFDFIPNGGNLIEFGVYVGRTMEILVKTAEQLNKPFKEIWGFDSWKGLPEDDPNVVRCPEWQKGVFNVVKDKNLSGPEEAISNVKKLFNRKINLISGFFEQSLTEELGQKLTDTASYIHVDCDIYLSAYQCLDWIFKHKICKQNCLIRFDDWHYWLEKKGGEPLAWEQIINKYQPKTKRLQQHIFLFLNEN